jgi:hypothetical protein
LSSFLFGSKLLSQFGCKISAVNLNLSKRDCFWVLSSLGCKDNVLSRVWLNGIQYWTNYVSELYLFSSAKCGIGIVLVSPVIIIQSSLIN